MRAARKIRERLGIAPTKTERFDVLSKAFPKQIAAILDPEPYVALTCGGRAGKTIAASLKWHHVRQTRPGQASVFISLTRESAKKILWRELKRQNKEWKLGLEFNETNLVVRDALGSVLYLQGANKDDLIDVLRGIPFVLAMFDEAAFFRRGLLERCIEDAILVRLLDYKGQCWVMSTPGMLRGGWFYQVSSGKKPGWSRHSWNMLDNPFMPPHMAHATPAQRHACLLQEMEAIKKRKGWTDKTPSYQREWLGQWADDSNMQVYPIEDANIIDRMPESWFKRRQDWITVLSMDYGVVNATTHGLSAYNKHENAVYMVESRRDVGLGTTSANNITAEWITLHRPTDVIGDAGGLGKAFIQEANTRGGLAIEAADKLGKRGHQEYVRDALLARPPRYFIVDDNPGNHELIEEMGELQFEQLPPDHPRYREREDPRGKKDLCDMALYGFMKCWSYFPVEPEAPPMDLHPEDSGRQNDPMLQYLM